MDTTIWNGDAGRGWVAAEVALDAMFAPFDALLLDGVASGRVLDVGCGSGGTTCAAARRLGSHGDCTGIDPSAPMIAAARARAARDGMVAARFIQADAQAHDFGEAGFDWLLSRFGVMFFCDPVAAFGNLRRAARPGAALRFAAWRGVAENSFMIAAETAAAPLLPGLPVRVPDAPGQFAFAARERMQAILRDSGWRDIDIQPVDVACVFPESELLHYLTWMGPVGRALQQVEEPLRARVVHTVRAAFEPFVQGSEVRFTAACWMANARAPFDV